jgi:hypothetical protein
LRKEDLESDRAQYLCVRFKFEETLLETMSSTGTGAQDIGANSPRR